MVTRQPTGPESTNPMEQAETPVDTNALMVDCETAFAAILSGSATGEVTGQLGPKMKAFEKSFAEFQKHNPEKANQLRTAAIAQLAQHPTLLTNIDFLQTLRDVGPFYKELLREIVTGSAPKNIDANTWETFKRTGQVRYGGVQRRSSDQQEIDESVTHLDGAITSLATAKETPGVRLRSTARYERAMAETLRTNGELGEARQYFLQSADDARTSGNVAGGLQTEDSGLYHGYGVDKMFGGKGAISEPFLNQATLHWKTLLQRVRQELAQSDNDENIGRVEMNILFHLCDATSMLKDRTAYDSWRKELENNAIYKATADQYGQHFAKHESWLTAV